MQLRRNTPKLRKNYLFLILLGVVGWWAAGIAAADPGHFYHEKAFFYQVFSVLLFGCSLVAWLALLWHFRMEVNEFGLTFRLRGITTRLPWRSVESLTVTKVADSWTGASLKIRLTPGAKIRGRWGSKGDGGPVYDLLAIDDFTVAPEEVIAGLQRYGGGRVDAQQYLQYRAAARSVARYMRGDAIHADPHLAAYMAEQRRIEADQTTAARDTQEQGLCTVPVSADVDDGRLPARRSSTSVAFLLLALLPMAYFVLTALGWNTYTAKKFTQVFVAVVGVVMVIRVVRSLDRQDDPVSGGVPRALFRVVLLTVTIWLAVGVVAGVVSGFEPVQATGSEKQLFDDRMDMVIGFPVAMLVVYNLGRWSVRLVPARRRLVWLAIVAIASRAVGLSLYPVGVAYGRAYNVPMPTFGEALVSAALESTLIFCFLAFGNVRASTQARSTRPRDDLAPR